MAHEEHIARFALELRRLQVRHDLSQRELERRARQAGFSLPKSTLSDALAGKRLPRQQVVRTFVWACTQSEAEVDKWTEKWRTVAEQVKLPPSSPTPPRPAPTPPPPSANPNIASATPDAKTERLTKIVFDPTEKPEYRIRAAQGLARRDPNLHNDIYHVLLEFEATLEVDDFSGRSNLVYGYSALDGDHSADIARVAWPMIDNPTAAPATRLHFAHDVASLNSHSRTEVIDFLTNWLTQEPNSITQILVIQRLAAMMPDQRQHFIQLASRATESLQASPDDFADATKLVEELEHDFAFEELVRLWG
jgi:hypothetical protein